MKTKLTWSLCKFGDELVSGEQLEMCSGAAPPMVHSSCGAPLMVCCSCDANDGAVRWEDDGVARCTGEICSGVWWMSLMLLLVTDGLLVVLMMGMMRTVMKRIQYGIKEFKDIKKKKHSIKEFVLDWLWTMLRRNCWMWNHLTPKLSDSWKLANLNLIFWRKWERKWEKVIPKVKNLRYETNKWIWNGSREKERKRERRKS